MSRPIGARDKVKRKFVNSFARQYLADHRVQMFCGEKQILEPVGKLYSIKLPNTRYYIGEQFIEQGETKKIYKFEELKDMGFVIISTKIGTQDRWEIGQKVRYEIRHVSDTGEHLGKIPKDHFVEYDPHNRAIRLHGPRAGPMRVSSWMRIEKDNTREGAGRKPNPLSVRKDPDAYLKKQVMKWRGEEEEAPPVYIQETAFMITDSNEIVCFPNTPDMPSILITGMKGVGKCIVQDEKHDFVLDGLGRWVKIASKPESLMVLNKGLKIEKAPVKECLQRSVGEVLEVRTRHGRKILLTPEHLLLTVSGWKKAEELNKKDFVAVPRRYNLDLKKKMPLNKLRLLAYFLGAGLWSPNRDPRFSTHVFEDHDLTADIDGTIAGFSDDLYRRVTTIKTKSEHHVLKEYLKKIGLYDLPREQFFIPNEIMELSNACICRFISAYYSVMGYMQKNISVKMPSPSETVARQIQHLLLRFGIIGTIQYKVMRHSESTTIRYLVSITGKENLLKFYDTVRPIKTAKAKQNQLRKIFIEDNIIPNAKNDRIPKEFWKLAQPEDWHPAFKALGYYFKRKDLDSMNFSVSRMTFEKIAKTCDNPIIKKFAESDVIWDEIISIEQKTGKWKVWDVEMNHPDHNFVANDMIVHNSFCLHSIVSRFFWKPAFNYKICILNDSSRETGTWNQPNSDPDQINILKRLNERPLPLPCVYLHPLVKEDYEKLFVGDVGFDVTIPFRDVVENHKIYLQLKDSSRYFTKIKEDLLECSTEAQAQSVFDSMVLHYNLPPQTANKIRAEFDTLFDTKMTDISTKGQKPWSTSKNPEIEYNPFTASVHAGVLPVLETEYVSNYRELLSIYFTYFVGDLFNRQKQDPDFITEKSELLLVVDEAHNISTKGIKSGADMLLRRCVREGRPRRIGSLLATQKFKELPDVIKDNSTYLVCFKNPGEAGDIANQYNMGKHAASQIKDLDKHQCLAYTTEHFIVYDTYGKQRKSRLNEIFVGKTLPPYSLHKRPKPKGG
jgi:intein/homing endonuclease